MASWTCLPLNSFGCGGEDMFMTEIHKDELIDLIEEARLLLAQPPALYKMKFFELKREDLQKKIDVLSKQLSDDSFHMTYKEPNH